MLINTALTCTSWLASVFACSHVTIEVLDQPNVISLSIFIWWISCLNEEKKITVEIKRLPVWW